MDAIHARSLPPRPNLEQYRKQAKDLLKACRAGDPDALRRIVSRGSSLGEASPEPERSSYALADAQLTIAREHGFRSWPKFAKHLQGLAYGVVREYEAAVDAIVTGDLDTLVRLLDGNPSLVRERSTRVHGATLLHYVAANGVENFRQKSPRNAVEIADQLLTRGAGADAVASMYGEDATTMELLVSSVHPAEAGVQVPLVDKLVDFGAAVNGPGDDGRPLLTAVAFQYAEAADVLVRRGARIDNIVTAAGLGREDLVRQFLTVDGLRPDVRVVGIGTGLPRHPRANLEWGIVLAAALGHARVVELMAECGVELSARGMVGFTAAHWAVVKGHADVVDVLLTRGAPLEDRNNTHHATVLQSAIWAARSTSGGNSLAIVDQLLRAGASTSVVEAPTGDEHLDELLRRHGAEID